MTIRRDSETLSDQAGQPKLRSPRPRLWLILSGLAFVAVVFVFREPLKGLIRHKATLANDAPSTEVVVELIERSADPVATLLTLWDTGKIIHREVAIRNVSRVVPRDQPLPPALEGMVLAAALDPDMNVREAAFSVLQQREHSASPALAAAQLEDPDPRVRSLGLNYLRQADPTVGVPLVAGLLNESDIRVLGMSLSLLENWAGREFGSKLRDTAQVTNPISGLMEYQAEGEAKTKAAAALAMEWWAQHQADFPPVLLTVPEEAYANRRAVPAPDFSLLTLGGEEVSLCDYLGKVVLINFWTTWCTACVAEMPALVELQKRHGDQLTILGVSLDYVPDSHGHLGGHATVEEQAHNDGHHDDHEPTAAALKRIRQKIVRTAKARGINYPILLDEDNEVGRRFNGGELPTTVIVDAEGNLRRRFVGARRLPVFEAMITEASQPVISGQKP